MLSVVGYSSSKSLLGVLNSETNEVIVLPDDKKVFSALRNFHEGVRGVDIRGGKLYVEPQWVTIHKIKPEYFAKFMNHPVYRALIDIHGNTIDLRLTYRNQDGTYTDRVITGQSCNVYNYAFECNRFTSDFQLEFNNRNTGESCYLELKSPLRIRFDKELYFMQAGNWVDSSPLPLGSIVLGNLLKGVLD